jgi:hypothetical protein
LGDGCGLLHVLQVDRVKSKLASRENLAPYCIAPRARLEELSLVLRFARVAPEARRYLHDLQFAIFGGSATGGDTEGKGERLRVDARQLAQEKPRHSNPSAAIRIGSTQGNLNHPLGYRDLVHSDSLVTGSVLPLDPP